MFIFTCKGSNQRLAMVALNKKEMLRDTGGSSCSNVGNLLVNRGHSWSFLRNFNVDHFYLVP